MSVVCWGLIWPTPDHPRLFDPRPGRNTTRPASSGPPHCRFPRPPGCHTRERLGATRNYLKVQEKMDQDIIASQWKSMEINGNQSKSIEINGNPWKSMVINGHRRKPREVGNHGLHCLKPWWDILWYHQHFSWLHLSTSHLRPEAPDGNGKLKHHSSTLQRTHFADIWLPIDPIRDIPACNSGEKIMTMRTRV